MTKQEYIDVIEGITHKPGRFPLIADIANRLELPTYKVSRLLKSLAAAGYLTREGNWYAFIPKREDMAIDEKVYEEEESPVVEEDHSKRRYYKLYDPNEAKWTGGALFQWVIFALGAGASVMSAYYTQIYLSESLNIFFSWFLSILMVSFSVIVFGLVSLMVSGRIVNNWGKYVLVAVFAALWLVTAGYSIASTVAGQFNQRARNVHAKVMEENRTAIDSSRIQLELDSRNDLIARKEEARKRLALLMDAAKRSLEDPERVKEGWNVLQSRIVAMQEMIAEIDRAIEATRDNERKLMKENPLASSRTEKQNDFFRWMAGIMNGNEDSIQFAMSLFPAIFLDIISPVLLTIFIFMRRKNQVVKPII